MSNIFRDPTEGATARRADLLRRRRDELVMMPHAIRRVYVARRARTAASLTIALVGAALLAIALQPSWAQYLARGLPGINPAVLCTLVVAMWLAGGFAYLAARALDEHRFAVAMSRLVMPGADVNDDIERLAHEHPDHLARDMAHRLEVRSAALPVLAAGVLLPVTALYAGAAVRAGGWPVIAEFEALVTLHANKLVACAGIGGVLAIAMTKRALRLPGAAAVFGGLAIVGIGAAIALSAWLVPAALLAMAAALVIRKLRVERELLQAEDPAAGSEVFTLRGFVRQLRASLAPVVARVRSVKPVWVLVAGLLVIAGITAMKVVETRHVPARATVAVAATPQVMPTAPSAVGPTGSRFTVQPMGDGRLRIELDLVDDKPVDIPHLAGLAAVPPMWSAAIRVRQSEGLAVRVDPMNQGPQDYWTGQELTTRAANCTIGAMPFGLRVQGNAGHIVLDVWPTLAPADC